jgi:hypothetical protein
MAKVTVRKHDLDRVVETAQRAAKRTNSVVVVSEERLDLTDDDSAQAQSPGVTKATAIFN